MLQEEAVVQGTGAKKMEEVLAESQESTNDMKRITRYQRGGMEGSNKKEKIQT